MVITPPQVIRVTDAEPIASYKRRRCVLTNTLYLRLFLLRECKFADGMNYLRGYAAIAPRSMLSINGIAVLVPIIGGLSDLCIKDDKLSRRAGIDSGKMSYHSLTDDSPYDKLVKNRIDIYSYIIDYLSCASSAVWVEGTLGRPGQRGPDIVHMRGIKRHLKIGAYGMTDAGFFTLRHCAYFKRSSLERALYINHSGIVHNLSY